jgi:hypothetical protein
VLVTRKALAAKLAQSITCRSEPHAYQASSTVLLLIVTACSALAACFIAVLVTREALAAKLAQSITPKVQDANISIMRSHLERHT